jgi:hypothetical protein
MKIARGGCCGKKFKNLKFLYNFFKKIKKDLIFKQIIKISKIKYF